MVGSSTCLQENFAVNYGMQYMYSQNLRSDSVGEIARKKWHRTYDGSKSSMDGVTLFYNNKTGSTAMNIDQLKNLDKLYDIRHLKEDWNGYGGKAISEEVVKTSEIIVKNVCNQPTIYPTGRASIQMQYELSDRSYLEFEIFEEKIVCMKVPQRIYAKASFKIMKDVNMELINGIVKEFYEG